MKSGQVLLLVGGHAKSSTNTDRIEQKHDMHHTPSQGSFQSTVTTTTVMTSSQAKQQKLAKERARRLDRNRKHSRKKMMKNGMLGVLTYSAEDIQRVWRGYQARLRIQDMKLQIAVITIQYWARDCLSRRHSMAMQKFALRKSLARETIGFFVLRKAILPLDVHELVSHTAQASIKIRKRT